jgi:hypothetical protein
MLSVIQSARGNIVRIAAVLGASWPTVYAWLDLLDISSTVGIHSQLGIPSQLEAAMRKAAEKQDVRMQRNVTITDSRWIWARHHAIDAKKSVSEIVEEALDLLRAKTERPS